MKRHWVFLLVLFCLLAVITIYFSFKISNQQLSTKENSHIQVLSQCVTDDQAKEHYHVNLTLTILGKPALLPNNLGIEDGCLHPIQVHDNTDGTVHIHYTKPFPFTLGDIFSIWGMTFSKNQFSGFFFPDRYHINLVINGKENTQFENYILKPDDTIALTITKK